MGNLTDRWGNPVTDRFGTPVTTGSNDGPAAPAKPSMTWDEFKGKAGSFIDKGLDLLDPSKTRMKIAGLFSGGANSPKSKNSEPTVIGLNQSAQVRGLVSPAFDWRVRVSLPSQSQILYQDSTMVENADWLLRPLNSSDGTDGVIFPYTPTISVTHNARYSEQALVHSNYKNYFYEGSDVSAINISGEFTAQNLDEGMYVLASIYFFRACTKMFFGDDPNAGQPPTLVYLDGYGDYYFPHVTCVITSFQHTMPAEVDYIDLGRFGRVPSSSTVSVTLQPIVSRTKATKFNHREYGNQGHADYLNGGFL
jgi:hypothetical protein